MIPPPGRRLGLRLAAAACAGIALAGGPSVTAAAAPEAGASPVVAPGSVAFDYRNQPALERLAGFETVVLSPRSGGAATALAANGARVLIWLQPFGCTWKGDAPPRGTLLGDAFALADSLGAWLKNADGTPAEVRDVDISECRVYDFRDARLAEGLAGLIGEGLPGVGGVLLDYGCASLSWEGSLDGVEQAVWNEWSAGYLKYLEALRRRRPEWRVLCQCQRWGRDLPERCDGLVLEKVGWSLNPYRRVLEEAAAHPHKHSILMVVDALGHEDPVRRRVTAALALLLDYGFSYRVEDAFGPHARRNPEHFTLQLGAWVGPYREVRSEVYLREAAYGFAVVNLSAEAFVWAGETVPPGDAMTVQTRDATTGAAVPPRRAE